MCEITIDCIYILYGFIFLCFYWFMDGYINGIKKHRKERILTMKRFKEAKKERDKYLDIGTITLKSDEELRLEDIPIKKYRTEAKDNI